MNTFEVTIKRKCEVYQFFNRDSKELKRKLETNHIQLRKNSRGLWNISYPYDLYYVPVCDGDFIVVCSGTKDVDSIGKHDWEAQFLVIKESEFEKFKNENFVL